MLSRTETERLAGMANALRPDWTVRSLVTLILTNLDHRAYQDIALALAWIATDPTTATPGRLLEAGPWWLTAKPGTSTPDAMPGRVRCSKDGHEFERASNCRICISDALEATDTDRALTSQGVPADRVRAILAAVPTPDWHDGGDEA
jgi:hypothetical protein